MTATELEYFTVNGYFFDVQQPLAGSSTGQPQFSVISGYVTFTPRAPATIYVDNLDIGSSVAADTALAMTPINGQIVGGQLCSIDMNNDPGVQLLANSPAIASALADAGYNTLVYDVSFSDIVYAHQGFTLGNFAFAASTDTTAVNITDPDLTRYTYAAPGAVSPALDDAPLNTYYTKPSSGIPASDLSAAVQADLVALSAAITRVPVPISVPTTLGAAASTDYVCFVNSGGVPTLPTAVNNTNKYTICNISGASVTVGTTSSQTINGSTLTIPNGASYDLLSDGANWRIV